MRVALLGTGIMGSGMARNVAAAGHEVVAWNRTRDKAEALAGAGVAVADSPEQAARGADVLVTVLFDAAATEAVVTGPDGAFAAAHGPDVWVQSATVGEHHEHLASLARAAGVTYLDAPVLGTRGPAQAGELVTLLAGAPDARRRAMPVIDAWSRKVVELGDAPGPASRMKLAVNTWLAVLDIGLAELVVLCRRLGVAPQDFLDTIEGGGLWAPYLGVKGPMMLSGDLEPDFPLVGLHKDLALARAAAGVRDGELPTLDGLLEVLRRALDQDLGDLDMAAVVRAVEASVRPSGGVVHPGTYVEEVPSGARTITGVATSIAAFVGRTRRGPTDRPVVVTSFGEFQAVFGGLWSRSSLGHSVREFFLNGGSTAVIVRLFQSDGDARTVIGVGSVDLEAASEGTWGNQLQAMVDHDTADPADLGLPATVELFNLGVRDAASGVEEQHRDVTVQEGHPRSLGAVLAAESQLVRLAGTPGTRPAEAGWTDSSAVSTTADDGMGLTRSTFIGGTAQAEGTGIYLLEHADVFNLLVIPPFTDVAADCTAVITAAAAYCERRRAMLLVDAPPDWRDVRDARAGVEELRATVGPATRNAALYFPWLRRPDPLDDDQMATFAPSGVVAGVMARTDAARGIWKAPAGLDAGLVGVADLEVGLTDSEIGELNPDGINCLRAMPGVGPVVWGARTMEGVDRHASEWKYVPVRRTALFIEESLYRGTQWSVFEPNDERLWAQLRLSAGSFMHDLFRQGAFQGAGASDAYFVRCDATTTTQDDIDRGIVTIVVGFAPLKPAEFIILRLQQRAGRAVA